MEKIYAAFWKTACGASTWRGKRANRPAVDVVFRLNRNWHNGTETPRMTALDLKRSEE
jgi:hypothetical protein